MFFPERPKETPPGAAGGSGGGVKKVSSPPRLKPKFQQIPKGAPKPKNLPKGPRPVLQLFPERVVSKPYPLGENLP